MQYGLLLFGLAALAPGCDSDSPEGTLAGQCRDGTDNDGDGLIDCADFGCEADPDCEIGDGGFLRRDGGRPDGGRFDAGEYDSGPIVHETLEDECADSTGTVFSASTFALEVDTDGLANDVGSCGGVSAPGNDGFLAFDLTAGEVWHFHVAASAGGRDPILYLLDDGCSSGVCGNRADVCTGGGDEHFTVTVSSTGRYYLGIDDHTVGGAVYQVSGTRVNCGDGVLSIGEACDSTDDCTAECRFALSGSAVVEHEVNDNLVEANQLALASASTRVSGSLGGDMCVTKDVFTFIVAESMSALEVRSLTAAGAPCAAASETPFSIVLRNVAGGVTADAMTDADGCASIDVASLNAGRYFLELVPNEGIDPTSYQIQIGLTAP